MDEPPDPNYPSLADTPRPGQLFATGRLYVAVCAGVLLAFALLLLVLHATGWTVWKAVLAAGAAFLLFGSGPIIPRLIIESCARWARQPSKWFAPPKPRGGPD